MSSLGLDVTDLFDGMGSREHRAPISAPRRSPPTMSSVNSKLELRRILAVEKERTGFPEVASLVRHRNAVRAVIERRFDVRLKREQPLWSEVAPHCADPAWTACVGQALMSSPVAVESVSPIFTPLLATCRKRRHESSRSLDTFKVHSREVGPHEGRFQQTKTALQSPPCAGFAAFGSICADFVTFTRRW